MILVLKGDKGSGKTTLLKDIIRRHGVSVQGFLSLKEMDRGRVTGISLLVLPEDETVPMASTTPMETDMSTGRFYFYPGVFARVNRRFEIIRPDLPFVFDEFGLLERDGGGHYPVFRALLESSHPTLVVVRSELADDLLSRIGRTRPYRVAEMSGKASFAAFDPVARFLTGKPFC